MQLIEAVPNLSAGPNTPALQAVLRALAATRGACVLHVDGNDDANRTVITLAGTPENVLKSLRVLFKTAAQQIDMRLHHGAHPRLGAVDVCPLVPLQNCTLGQAARYARELAQFVGEELQIPIYLYEENARTTERIPSVVTLFPVNRFSTGLSNLLLYTYETILLNLALRMRFDGGIL